MEYGNSDRNEHKRSIYILAMVNTGIWAISIITMVFLMQYSQGAKGLFPILGGGSAVGIALISKISKMK